jgi:AraC family transcriptional regulator
MKPARLDFRDQQSRRATLGDGEVITRDGLGWDSIYFEHRRANAFETAAHVIDERYLMVKLNPLSNAERWIDGVSRDEKQQRVTAVYVPNGCPHRVRYKDFLGSLNLMALRPSVVDEFADELGMKTFKARPQFASGENRLLLEISETLHAEIREGNPHGRLFADIYARTIAAHLVSRSCRQESRTGRDSALGTANMRRLEGYIAANLSSQISLADLAAQLGLSKYYFCRQFKEATGISPYQYVLKKRIEFACVELQRDHMSIQDIAFASGFGDPVQFSKQFRRLHGIAPSAYRARYLSAPRAVGGVR